MLQNHSPRNYWLYMNTNLLCVIFPVALFLHVCLPRFCAYFSFFHACSMPCPAHSSWFHYLNIVIFGGQQNYEASQKSFSPSSCHVLPHRSKYSQLSVLRYPQPIFYLDVWADFTPCKMRGKIIVSIFHCLCDAYAMDQHRCTIFLQMHVNYERLYAYKYKWCSTDPAERGRRSNCTILGRGL